MSIFQMIATLFALMMLYVVNIHRRKLSLSFIEVSFWYSTWILFIIISLFPNLLLELAQTLNFVRVFDLLVVVAFMVLTVLVVSSYFTQRENARKLEELVRKMAIKKTKEKN